MSSRRNLPRTKGRKSTFVVRLPANMATALRLLAQLKHASVNSIAAVAINRHLYSEVTALKEETSNGS